MRTALRCQGRNPFTECLLNERQVNSIATARSPTVAIVRMARRASRHSHMSQLTNLTMEYAAVAVFDRPRNVPSRCHCPALRMNSTSVRAQVPRLEIYLGPRMCCRRSKVWRGIVLPARPLYHREEPASNCSRLPEPSSNPRAANRINFRHIWFAVVVRLNSCGE